MLKNIGSTSSRNTVSRRREEADRNGADAENLQLRNHEQPSSDSQPADSALSTSSKENNRSDKALREQDYDQIYSSVSRTSLSSNVDPKSEPKSHLDEEPKVIGNAFLFSMEDDKQQRRYSSDEEEKGDEGELNGSIDHNVDDQEQSQPPKPATRSTQTFSTFLPNMFGTRPTAQDQQSNAKRKFQFFRKRGRDKDKKPETAPPEDAIQGNEVFTGERAKQLIGALSFGAPAISLVASCLLVDEHGISRAPLLLSLLGFRITDISNTIYTKNRKFRIDLEYGVGPQRMTWSVERTAKDLLYLHSRFKFDNWRKEVVRNKISDLPKYPIPPLRNGIDGHRAKSKKKGSVAAQGGPHLATHEPADDHDPVNIDETLNSNHLQSRDIHSRNSVHRRDSVDSSVSLFSNQTLRQLVSLRARLSRASSISGEENSPEAMKAKVLKNQDYINQVENYLHELMQLVELKPHSNRLFLFFEISPISSLLSYESGYIGKQGVVHIGGTTKSQGWRVGHFKANDLKGMIDRRQEKWLLVRNAYVMYVSDIKSTAPLEVFLVDSKFRISHRGEGPFKDDEESDYDDSSIMQRFIDDSDHDGHQIFKHLKITLENSERKLVIIPKSEKQQKLWLKSLYEMKSSTIWSRRHRFDSFAPVRDNCFAQWFVDGRDYFWAVSSAIEMAKDVVYIHDWWLSPELYLRRPANGNQQWRIDRLLQRKAKQGVKIFVIVYRNVGTTVATDSLYTKHSILSLHEENIHVIRSPNQLLQNTFFWAHHEKLCIIDQTVAFVGGIDLCYGRFDTPDHVLVDDSKINFDTLDKNQVSSEKEYVDFQIFPGKDYSNPRVKDFFNLDKPYESMYDRNVTPRMPWHDVHMLTSGKVARDLARHFVQRWNYLLRQKRPSRFTPLLTPPSDFTEDEEEKLLKLGGTCEVQLLRSSGNWSLGLKEPERSIHNAYLKLIETSEHFVYIENQFFITSCFIDGNEIENRIGDALVDRIIKAYQNGENWKAVIVIPLMPGFESQVDKPDGSSVRVIMQCQFMSISRGATSIFAKLRKYGINPGDYIQFFSLRKWGIIGPDRSLVTEQLYVHAKTMIVDDRIAIIGSANINERSMRGVRDSEVATVVRDREMVHTKMDGEEYLAGKFAHSLRIRLMREHLGVNVDIVDIVERRFKRFEDFARSPDGLNACTNTFKNKENQILSAVVELASRDILGAKDGTFRWHHFQKNRNSKLVAQSAPLDDIDEMERQDNAPTPLSLPISFNNRTGTHESNKGIRDKKKHSYDARVQHNEQHKLDVFGEGLDKYKSQLAKRARLNSGRFLKNLSHKVMQHSKTDLFLPDDGSIMEFLESDDYAMHEEMDEESEKIITERNKERYLLLKKVSYLQRLTALQKDQKEEEAKKRARAGMSPSGLDSTPSTANGFNDSKNTQTAQTANRGSSEEEKQKIVSSLDGSALLAKDSPADTNLLGRGEAEVKEKMFNDTPEYGAEEVPIVSLSEHGVQDLIEEINPKYVENFTTFVDPYCFEDPLHEEFYYDLWFEHARRNTEIFRMVFHSQPDDTVRDWTEYKVFSKLQRAFQMAQQDETRERKERRLYGDGALSDAESDVGIPPHATRRNTTINVNELNGDVGLLGQPPTENIDSSDKRTHAAYDPNNEGESGSNDSENGEPKQNGDFVEEKTPETTMPPTAPRRRRRRTPGTRRKASMEQKIFERDTAERILREVQGHLVMFPCDWLQRELDGGNWFYNTDRIPPIDIYD